MAQAGNGQDIVLAAMQLHQQGRLAEARPLYRQALAANPRDAVARNLLGETWLAAGNLREAEACFELAVRDDPALPQAQNNLGVVRRAQGRLAEALAAFSRALNLRPDFLDAAFNRAVVLLLLEDGAQALPAWDAILAQLPQEAAAHRGRGDALRLLDRREDALAAYEAARTLAPEDAVVLVRCGIALAELGRAPEAVPLLEQATRLAPGNADAWANLGSALRDSSQRPRALEVLGHALKLRPDDPTALANQAGVLQELGRRAEAEQVVQKALALAPDHVGALQVLGINRFDEGRHEEALAAFRKVLAKEPEIPRLFGYTVEARQHLCDWPGLEAEWARLAALVAEGRPMTGPFGALSTPLTAAELLRLERDYVAQEIRPAPPLHQGERWRNPRIRLAYLSSDMQVHAVAQQMAGVFELHDRSRFEVTAISLGRNDGSPMRQRLERAFEHFIDAGGMSDDEIAALVRDRGTDILVDLNVFTLGGRFGVAARRPAPIQVNFLGFPGTCGSDVLDYILADPHIIPPGAEAGYAEQVVRLPFTYLPNDHTRRIAEATPTRAEMGLPAQGFVFCGFNGAYKITPWLWDIWMRLLAQVPGSVLWLRRANPVTQRNLKAEAAKRGVAPERVLFGPSVPDPARHLARHRLADLFLDTPYYNAHSTASDALFAGLPVLTVPGGTFASRVCAGLVNAVGLPDCVLPDHAAYEAAALHLARDPAALAALKARLVANLPASPLFDTPRFTRHLESALARMWERWQSGAPPVAFDVPA